MHYYWAPLAILFVVAACCSASTWSPFQSRQVKDICSHMTKAERAAAMKRGGFWGLLIGIVPCAVGLTLGPLILSSALIGVTLCALLFPLVALALWKKWLPYVHESQQSFLASTEFAKKQGIEAEDIQLFNWQE